MVLLMRIERTTSPLPRECSTTELQEQKLERENGIEPSYAAWKAAVLPLNYSRTSNTFNNPAKFLVERAGFEPAYS